MLYATMSNGIKTSETERIVKNISWILYHRFTYECLCVVFSSKTKPSSCPNHYIDQTWISLIFSLSKLKTSIKGKRFATIKDVRISKQKLLAVPKSAF